MSNNGNNVSIGMVGNANLTDNEFVEWLETTVFPSLATKDNGPALLEEFEARFFDDMTLDVSAEFEFLLEAGKPLYDALSDDEKHAARMVLHTIDLGDYLYGNPLPPQGGGRRAARKTRRGRRAARKTRRGRRARRFMK